MIATYTLSSKNQGFRFRVFAEKSLTLASVILLGGVGLVLLYAANYLTSITFYNITITISASLLIAWGILTLVKMKHTLMEIPKLTRLIPLLGLQCSLPFLITTLTILEAAPHIMLLASISFTLGYVTSYIVASTSLDLARSLESLMGSRILLIAQGLALIGAGGYIPYNVKTII